jgi:predicted SAM-dependent methyltransferase
MKKNSYNNSVTDKKKLHLGCGSNLLPGWVNTDFPPKSDQVIELDATKTFPFDNDSFDYVFSEHMIEHISFEDGHFMLKECFRILKPGGKIRCSTPDLRFLIDLHQNPNKDINNRYINWAVDKFWGHGIYLPGMVFNNFVRNWGHLFIYDKETLTHSLIAAGFQNIESFSISDSNDGDLKNLENEARRVKKGMPAGFLQLESMTFEGTKPA